MEGFLAVPATAHLLLVLFASSAGLFRSVPSTFSTSADQGSDLRPQPKRMISAAHTLVAPSVFSLSVHPTHVVPPCCRLIRLGCHRRASLPRDAALRSRLPTVLVL